MSNSTFFQPNLLKGKVALITGGGTGINFEIARYFGKYGASVAIMGRREEVIKKAAEELSREGFQSLGVSGDVRSTEGAEKIVQQVVTHFGKMDILVNGAAGNFLCPSELLSTNAFKTVIDIDLVGTFNMSRAAFQELKKTKGVILNISATLHYTATVWQIHASAAKAGVDSVTRSIAREWGTFGIRSVGIAPGPIADTEGLSKLSLGPTKEQLQEIFASSVPLGRSGRKDEIANAAVFLVSDAASFITGHTVVVDGGSYLFNKEMISREALTQVVQYERSKKKSKL